jgi:hypothetical protein
MKPETANSVRSFLVELVVYAAFVAGYFFLVLHFLGDWLHDLFLTDRRSYAALALGLIIGQGILLDALTRLLLAWLKPRSATK